jgi:putative membrane protein
MVAAGVTFALSSMAQTTSPGAGANSANQDATRGTATTTAGDNAAHNTHDAKQHAKQTAAVTPQTFASKAAVIGKAEIELANLALNNTKNEEIRIYAERMIKDHTAADAKLKKIAAKENLTLPQALDPEHRAVKDKLAALKDDAFDREYRKEMAKGHDKAVALFESAAQTEQMPKDLREFAASTLDTLEDHREDAHDMHEKAQKKGGA